MTTLMYRLTAYGNPNKAGHKYVQLHVLVDEDDEEFLPRRRKPYPGWWRS